MVHHYKLSLTSIASVLFVISFYSATAYAQSQSAKPTIEYNFPMDGSKYVPSNTPIILRPTVPLSLSVASNNLVVTGTMTGHHDGSMVLSDDKKTLIFTPTDPFESGERVSVGLGTGITATNRLNLAPVSFSFEVQDNPSTEVSPFLNSFAGSGTQTNSAFHHFLPPTHILSNPFVTDTFGEDTLTVTINNNPSPGYLFLATFNYQRFFDDTDSIGAYRMVLDQNGNPVYRQHAVDREDWDFQPQPNGRMTFFELPKNMWYAMDSNYNIVDSFATTAPYTADLHDFEILTHNHALMLSYYPIKPYDLSKYGGSDTATLIGGVIEEIDSLKNPVWIWRSWDSGHYLDTDATFDLPSETLTGTPFDAVHPNAVSVDTDGNIILSARELDEVSKISRKDGSFIWRLGGKHNQFTFIDDSIHFSHQHGVRRIANGNITLFDNGNFNHYATLYDTIIDPSVPDTSIDTTHPTFSRACEYDVNTDSMTATLAWHYDHDSTIASTAMGFVQRLPNNNTLICWGLDDNPAEGLSEPTITEVTPDKQKTFEMIINSPYQVYRAFKYPSPNYDTGFVAPASPDTLLPSAVTSEVATPNSPELGSPFPNPSNGSSMVTINATPSDRLELDLYDPLGREVQTYFSGIAASPTFSLKLLTSDLANGAYELVLRGEGGTVSKQFTILH
jgi:Arylsulfotransferase (ASST)/Bacterial Ig-like domain